MPKQEIIPFGKYRGQPLEVLASDKSYLDWLTAQDWFRSKFGNLYTIVVNNFSQPQDTPEHNKLQAKFLDDEYCLKFAYACWPKAFKPIEDDIIGKMLESVASKYPQERWGNLQDRNSLGLRLYLEDTITGLSATRVFEEKGVDVKFEIHYGIYLESREGCYGDIKQLLKSQYGDRFFSYDLIFPIEIKPILSDDFPSVLRQMKANDSKYLFVSEYSGMGATLDQVRQIFDESDIRLLLEDEVDNCQLPEWLNP